MPRTRAPAGRIIWLPTYTGWVTSAINGSPLFATAVLRPVSNRRCTWVPCRSSWDCARAGITAAEKSDATAQKNTLTDKLMRFIRILHPAEPAEDSAVHGLSLVSRGVALALYARQRSAGARRTGCGGNVRKHHTMAGHGN